MTKCGRLRLSNWTLKRTLSISGLILVIYIMIGGNNEHVKLFPFLNTIIFIGQDVGYSCQKGNHASAINLHFIFLVWSLIDTLVLKVTES